jgi:hypothetical protein
MKKPSTDLFDLIKTLDKSEKRFFQQFAHRHSIKGENIYYQLFKMISVQSTYNEEGLKQELAGQKAAKNFAVVKKQLYEQLVLALHQYHQVHSISEKIKRNLHITKVLLRKRLFKQCQKRIKLIEKTIQNYNLKEYQIELLELKYQLAAHESFKNTSVQDLESYQNELLKAIRDIEDLGKMRQASHTIQALHYKKVRIESLKDYEVFQELLTNAEKTTNLRLEVERLRGLATYYFMSGQPKESHLANVQLLEWFEEHDKLLILFPQTYISTFNNYLIDNLQLKNFGALEVGLKKLERLQEEVPFKNISNLTMRMAQQRFLLELNWIITTGDFQKSDYLIPQLDIFLKKNQSTIHSHLRVTLYYLMAYCCFATSKFDDALGYLNKILDTKEEVVTEIIEFARLLNILTHFELGNFELLESLILTTRRWLRNKRNLYKTEKTIFLYLRKWMNVVDRRGQQEVWDNLLIEVEDCKTNPKEQRVFNYFNVSAWALSKRDKMEFMEVYKRLV